MILFVTICVELLNCLAVGHWEKRVRQVLYFNILDVSEAI